MTKYLIGKVYATANQGDVDGKIVFDFEKLKKIGIKHSTTAIMDIFSDIYKDFDEKYCIYQEEYFKELKKRGKK